MKRILLTLMTLVVLCACNDNMCKINGTLTDPVDTVRLIDRSGTILDVAAVKDGVFTLKCEINPDTEVALFRGEDAEPVTLIPDVKNITVTFADGAPVVTGSPMSQELLELQQWTMTNYFDYMNRMMAAMEVGDTLSIAATETEMKEAKLRMEDALNATRAAVEEGVIAGGGSAYIHASKDVEKLVEKLDGDEKTGAKVILKALEAPLYYIVANAGLEGAVIINKVKESKKGTGFDAAGEKYVDMVAAGILDPVKVTRSALLNATSVASTFLTTESVVANIQEDTPAMPANPGMGMM